MGRISGHRMPLSIPRRFIGDLLHASRRVPVVTFERQADLSLVVAARNRVAIAPQWAALFAKAFAIVAAQRAELRRAYLPLPWPHLWEASESIVSIAVERDYRGEPAVFFGMLRRPDAKSLPELTAKIAEWKFLPVEQVSTFNRAIRYAQLPYPLRRCLWWLATSWAGALKAKNFGTLGISLTGSTGATATNLIGPVTASLNCGVIQPNGTVTLRLHFDHRVFDGMLAARALQELEQVLNNEILAELYSLAHKSPSGERQTGGALLRNRMG